MVNAPTVDSSPSSSDSGARWGSRLCRHCACFIAAAV